MSTKELSQQIDSRIFLLAEKYGFVFLSFSIGLIYSWFGVLKFFPGLSPAEVLAGDTLTVMTFGLVPTHWLLWILAAWELLIGMALIFGIRTRLILMLLLLHMMGTLTPFFIFPELTFQQFPFQFSLVGQYIMKNLVIISAAIILYARGKKPS